MGWGFNWDWGGSAEFNKGMNAWAKGQFETAMNILKPLAEEGNIKAQAQVGSMYRFGNGVPGNKEKAIMWYSKAADQGSKEAKYIIVELEEMSQVKDAFPFSVWNRTLCDNKDYLSINYEKEVWDLNDCLECVVLEWRRLGDAKNVVIVSEKNQKSTFNIYNYKFEAAHGVNPTYESFIFKYGLPSKTLRFKQGAVVASGKSSRRYSYFLDYKGERYSCIAIYVEKWFFGLDSWRQPE